MPTRRKMFVVKLFGALALFGLLAIVDVSDAFKTVCYYDGKALWRKGNLTDHKYTCYPYYTSNLNYIIIFRGRLILIFFFFTTFLSSILSGARSTIIFFEITSILFIFPVTNRKL